MLEEKSFFCGKEASEGFTYLRVTYFVNKGFILYFIKIKIPNYEYGVQLFEWENTWIKEYINGLVINGFYRLLFVKINFMIQI